jgi:hypothetical protein
MSNIKEELPTNNVGSGNIAGAGPNDDPPIRKDKKKLKKFKSYIKELAVKKPSEKETLGITRDKMPQVDGKDYPELYQYFKDSGIDFKKKTVAANKLKATQKEFSDVGIVKSIEKSQDKTMVFKPLIISSDNYIMDGHHRWLSVLNTDDTRNIPVIQVNLPGRKLLDVIKKFPKTTYRKITESYDYIVEQSEGEPLSDDDMKNVERFADRLGAKFNIDVEFTRHFKERANDPRNKKQVTTKELVDLFQKTFTKFGNKIKMMGDSAEAVLMDLVTDLNLPFVLKFNRRSNEIEMVHKTIMRKKGFKTPDPILKV